MPDHLTKGDVTAVNPGVVGESQVLVRDAAQSQRGGATAAPESGSQQPSGRAEPAVQVPTVVTAMVPARAATSPADDDTVPKSGNGGTPPPSDSSSVPDGDRDGLSWLWGVAGAAVVVALTGSGRAISRRQT